MLFPYDDETETKSQYLLISNGGITVVLKKDFDNSLIPSVTRNVQGSTTHQIPNRVKREKEDFVPAVRICSILQ